MARHGICRAQQRCGGDVHALYIKAAVNGKATMRSIGTICLRCKHVTLNETYQAMDQPRFTAFERWAGGIPEIS